MRKSHQTQWAAQFAVASELCKRGYEVALTMGNHPSVDIMVTSPSGVAFGVDVKGLYKRNFWVLREKPFKASLFYVLAFVPESATNEFCILTQEEANAEIAEDVERARQRALAKGRSDEKVTLITGVSWKFAQTHKDAWAKLPA